MTEQEQAELEKAQVLLREAKPDWLKKMAPDSPIAFPQIGERQAKFDMGFKPIALDGDSSGGGGGDEFNQSLESIVLVDGILYYATLPGELGDIVT